MAKKIINGIFVGSILLVLLAGCYRTFFRPKDINSYENRYAAKTELLTLSGFREGTFQSSVDAALGDQVQFSEIYKRIYNRVSSRYLGAVLEPIITQGQPRYIDFLGKRIFGNGHITYPTRALESVRDEYDVKIANINETAAKYPDTEFYAYYLEMDHDMNFETGIKTGIYDYLRENLTLPADHVARLEINSFEEFTRCFYRTDHHWNLEGSYRGYRETAALLGVTEPLLEPTARECLGTWSGTKAAGSGIDNFTEEFWVYRYEFPPMWLQVNGATGDYGNQSGNQASYGDFYGWDNGEVIVHTERPERENLLLIGNSYDNAILKLLASHFNETYAIDLRYYKNYAGKDFSFSEFMDQHKIDKVLLIGDVDYFRAPEFLLLG